MTVYKRDNGFKEALSTLPPTCISILSMARSGSELRAKDLSNAFHVSNVSGEV
jgi:hypothetical protein